MVNSSRLKTIATKWKHDLSGMVAGIDDRFVLLNKEHIFVIVDMRMNGLCVTFQGACNSTTFERLFKNSKKTSERKVLCVVFRIRPNKK